MQRVKLISWSIRSISQRNLNLCLKRYFTSFSICIWWCWWSVSASGDVLSLCAIVGHSEVDVVELTISSATFDDWASWRFIEHECWAIERGNCASAEHDGVSFEQRVQIEQFVSAITRAVRAVWVCVKNEREWWLIISLISVSSVVS